MNDKVNDGGPAFPPHHNPKTHESGMTLRDYFAAKALAGLMARDGRCRKEPGPNDALEPGAAAMWAYRYADQMLQARES